MRNADLERGTLHEHLPKWQRRGAAQIKANAGAGATWSQRRNGVTQACCGAARVDSDGIAAGQHWLSASIPGLGSGDGNWVCSQLLRQSQACSAGIEVVDARRAEC